MIGRATRWTARFFKPAAAWRVVALATLLGALPRPAGAVLIIGPLDPNSGNPTGGQNTTAPGGALANSGWQFEGVWESSFTGTPIAPNYFITAAHVGGNVGDTFSFQGQNYTTTAAFSDPSGSDLRIWQVSGTFPTYAPLYTSNDEAGQTMVVFGRGGPPGSSTANGVSLHGWQWGSDTGSLSWGSNLVVSAGVVPDAPPGQYLLYRFDQTLGPNTGTLTAGDSGGGVFIQKNGVWQLAGINFATDGPYNTLPASDPNSSTTSFSASLYDARGLYFDGSSTVISGANPVPSGSISTRISTEIGWIFSVTSVPEPGSLALFLGGGLLSAPLVLRGLRKAPARTPGRGVTPPC